MLQLKSFNDLMQLLKMQVFAKEAVKEGFSLS